MKKKVLLNCITLLSFCGAINVAVAKDYSSHEVDVQSTAEERKFSTIRVTSPEASDVVTLTDLSSGENRTIQPGENVKVKVGQYRVEVKMEDGYTFDSGEFKTESTERYDVAVAGYGTIQVSGPAGTVTATREGGQSISFPIGELKTLPIGNYNVTIQINGKSSAQTKALIATNTTTKLTVN